MVEETRDVVINVTREVPRLNGFVLLTNDGEGVSAIQCCWISKHDLLLRSCYSIWI